MSGLFCNEKRKHHQSIHTWAVSKHIQNKANFRRAGKAEKAIVVMLTLSVLGNKTNGFHSIFMKKPRPRQIPY